MFAVKAVAETGNAGSNLVKLDALLTVVYVIFVNCQRSSKQLG